MSQTIQSKDQFLQLLSNQLIGMDEASKQDILYDYEEHFSVGLSKGMSEPEIALALGSPKVIAAQYRFEQAIKAAENNLSPSNVFKAIFTALSLGLFNLIFVVGFYVGMVASLLAITLSFIIVALSGFLVMARAFFPALWPELIVMNGVPWLEDNRFLLFLLGIALTVLGSMIAFGLTFAIRFVFKGTIQYLKANVQIVQNAAKGH